MNKLLFLVPNDSSYKHPIGDAFKELGWRVKFFDYRKGDLPIRVYRFIPLVGGFKRAEKSVLKRIISINKGFEPDLILVAKGELLNKDLLMELKAPSNLIVNLFPDYLNHWELIKEISKYYDFFFTFDKTTIRKLEKEGRRNIRYLPQATQIEEKIDIPKIYDVSFLGTYRPWREKYLSYLKEFDFNLWGDKRWENTSLKQFYRGPRVKLSKMKSIIKKSKINLNIFFEGTPMEGVSLRPYEITGSGGFLLTQYVKDYDNVFKNNKEIVYFKSPKQMRDLVRYYLDHPEEREKIAARGYKRTVNDHTYKKRITQLLDSIGFYGKRKSRASSNFTGEYCVPGVTPKRIVDDHLERYKYAARHIEGKDVLDIACGVGYGSNYLARKGAKSVLGIDITPKVIDYARRNYGHPDCKFNIGDITRFRSNKKFDVVVCFETIEHIMDDAKAIKNLKVLLKKGGLLLISSPNRPITSPHAKSLSDAPNNRYHVREYTPGELTKILRENGYKVKDILGQRYRPVFNIKIMDNLIDEVFNPNEKSSPRLSKTPLLTPRYFVIIAQS